jgi:Glycosyl transferases group 1
VRLAFVHYPGRIVRLEDAREGRAPTEFLFGAIELERAGHQVTHHEVDPRAPTGRVARRLIDLQAGKGRLPPHASAAALSGTRAMFAALAEADVVIATTTGTTVALGTWRALGRLRRPLVGIVAGLVTDEWRPLRRLTTRRVLRSCHSVLYGPGELDEILRRAPELEGRVHVNCFGVDTRYWSPAPGSAPQREVLAIGNDGNRDWATLVAASAELPVPVRILTSHARPSELPANVSWQDADWHRQVLGDAEVRDAYCNAAVVVVPLRDVAQPSGQSVTLQASACGRPVVLSRTRGLWSETLRDGETVCLVPSGDPSALAAAIRGVLDDVEAAEALGQRARAATVENASVQGFATRLEAICELALSEHVGSGALA